MGKMKKDLVYLWHCTLKIKLSFNKISMVNNSNNNKQNNKNKNQYNEKLSSEHQL